MNNDTKIKLLGYVRDIVIAVTIVAVILTALWAYTGQFPETPMVVVTSQSMMHPNEPFGRIGTIDPGDLVLVKKVVSRDDIQTRGNSSNPATKLKTYGDYGDVIIYYPMGDRSKTPIIHRAICWIEKKGDKYDVKEYGIHDADSVTIPELHLYNYRPTNSGFITKGDNNEYPDEMPNGGICEEPVKMSWIVGKARGEIPWFGLIKLIFPPGNIHEPGGPGYTGPDKVIIWNAVAPADEWICLGVSLFIIIVLPSSKDIYNTSKKAFKKLQEKIEERKSNKPRL
ncbi:MAG: S26 family signal peptidase [Thermoplasmata archaeon]|nr:S26 family signal peptidase [Thermoplasmata archaeon]